MTDTEICSLQFDHLCAKMIELNIHINKMEGLEDRPALSYGSFIMLSQSFQKNPDDNADDTGTVSAHLDVPRQLMQELDRNRNRHTARTMQDIWSVESHPSTCRLQLHLT